MKKIRRRGRKILSILLSMTMAAGMMLTGITPGTNEVKAASSLTSADFLKTNGTSIRKNYGNGEKVYLRGTNAGGWLVQENWMNPTNAPDQRTMMDTLANRFGTSTRDSLVAAYEDNYWTTQDFDNCAAMGMSVIRLPFTYMNLCDDNGNLKSNAWRRLDWFVSNCSSRGMYVILDMHGAFGSQNGMDHSGEVNDGKQLYYNQGNKNKTLNLWAKIAEHFKGNPAVAAYDILNEPGIKAAATYSLHWDFYNEIYNTIRSKDSNHIIIMESCWDADNLPRPSQYGWTNVAYEYHYYPWNYISNSSGQASYTAGKVRDIANHNYGVPTFVGEFTCFDQEDAWRNTMSTYNQQGWHWTTWSYKVTGNSSWGIYNHNPEKVDIYNDSADTIKNKWSAVGTENGWKNDKIYNLVKPYLSGTVTSTGGSTTDDSDNNSTSGVATLYEHSNYGGWAVSLEEGSYDYKDILAKGIVNDQISSLRVSDGYKVTIYDDEGFKGKSKEFTSDASYVDKTSSIKIEKINNQTSTTTSYNTVKLPNGKYSIKSVANEKYVATENGGSDPIVANRDNYSGSWETFYIVNNDDGTVSIKADANNKYICAVLDEENQLTPRSDSISTWEKFKIYKINDSEYGIRSAENGKYVKADLDNGGKLIVGSDSIAGAWEAFNIEKVGDTTTNDNVATFYENSNYSGWSVSLPEGTYDYSDIIAKGIKNDAISSLKVSSGYKVTLYDNAGFKGTSKEFTGDASYVGNEINDKTSSIKIEKWDGSSSVTYNTVKLSNGKYSIKSVANEKYVVAENGGSDPIVANRDSYGGSWETFYLINNDDGTVSLKADANNKYVCAVLDEENQLVPRSESVGTWEKFQIYKISDTEYGLKSAENGKYVKADLDNGGKLIAGSDSIAGAWEAFNIEKLGDETSSAKATFYENSNYSGWSVALSEGRYDYGTMISKGIKNDQISSVKVADGYKVTLYNDAGFAGSKKTLFTDASGLGDFNDKTSAIVIEKVEKADFNNSNAYITSIANGQVVCAENGGSETIVANRSSCGGAWETFQIVNNDDGTVSLKSIANGKYVCAVVDEQNQLLPRSSSASDWEKFEIVEIQNGEYALKARANNKYVKADLDNGGKLVASSDSVAGAWEAFKITKTGESSGLTYSGSEKKAEFYLDSDYNGTKVSLSAGKYDYNAMVSAGIKNDALSSVKVPDGYRVTLYNDAGFQGGAKVLLQDTSNLGGFNDKTSSIIIEKVERPNFNNADTYITSIANNKVVCAENGGNDTIVANRGSCGGAWETIQIVNNNDGTVSLRSAANGKYVCAIVDEHNQLVPRSGSIGTWEKFIIEKIADNEYAIYSLANGKYVQANLNDGGKLFATSETVAGAWEVFDINRN